MDDGGQVNYAQRVDLPPPDVLATEVPLASLTGTAKGLAALAERAGYTVRATRALGPRIPKRVNDPVERVASLALTGEADGWRFAAVVNAKDGWEVLLKRPGWPVDVTNTVALRKALTAQVPAVVR